MVHPLPKGEGWGEGEGIARMSKALGAVGGAIKMHPRFSSRVQRVLTLISAGARLGGRSNFPRPQYLTHEKVSNSSAYKSFGRGARLDSQLRHLCRCPGPGATPP